MIKEMVVLVTAIGTVNGGIVVSELKKSGIYTIGANSTPREYVVTAKFVDEYYEFPSVIEDQKSYLSFVLGFCQEHKVTHIICFIDEEVALLTGNREKFATLGIKLCLPDYEIVSVCHYKDRFAKWIESELPEVAIQSYDRTKVNESDLPLFVKPIEGRASKGCRKLTNANELHEFICNTDIGNGYVIQKYTVGEIVGVDIIRNRKFNQVNVIQKKELARNSNGCGTVVEIIDDPGLNRICALLAEKLDLNGLINAEFFMTVDGPRVIEINPRLPAGTSYSCMAGGNTVLNTIHIADEEPCEFSGIAVGKVYARRYETYEM